MAAFYVDMALTSRDGTRAQNLRVKANTGARYTRLPGCLLTELGWEPSPYDLPWGWPTDLVYQTGLRVCEVNFRIGSENYPHSIIFGVDDCEPTLGSWSALGYVFEADEKKRCVTPRRVIYR